MAKKHVPNVETSRQFMSDTYLIVTAATTIALMFAKPLVGTSSVYLYTNLSEQYHFIMSQE
ncbi:hypothetical protein DD238_003340 [Peronospora effusa]|uniref:Uncharacterized protein n=1 Tax=Peronospora effusa TaxID=542832 RepID=A0A3M6VQW1_9STRA|nr:hypothetical protein DD238_003340 [Peronospora effusa]RQM18621.1 hypothetical protein DD237_001571 [Peronospora effusa]